MEILQALSMYLLEIFEIFFFIWNNNNDDNNNNNKNNKKDQIDSSFRKTMNVYIKNDDETGLSELINLLVTSLSATNNF